MASSYLAVGYTCNHKCICCPLTTYDRLHRPLSLDEITDRLDRILSVSAIDCVRKDALETESNHITISGGEPMLHRDFLRVLQIAAEKGFSVTVLTNSSQCRNRELAQKISEIMPKGKFDIVTAVHSSHPAVHDSITGVEGSLLETLEGLDNLVEAGVPVTIKHIFNRISLPGLLNTFTYLEMHYPPKVSFQFCTMDYSGMAAKNVDRLFVTMKEIRPQIEKLLDLLESRMVKKRNISFIESPFCMTDPYYWKYFRTGSGHLTAYAAPNTEERKVAFEVDSECGTWYEPCQACAVRKWCSGTWKSAYKYGKEQLLDPVLEI